MKYFKLLWLLLLLAGMFSCSDNNQKRKWKAVSDLASSELLFQEIEIEAMLGRPYKIGVADSLLIILDDIDGKALLLYNVVNQSYMRVLNIGQGPGEVLNPIDIDVSDKVINVLQRQNGKCRRYIIDKLLSGEVLDFENVELGRADRIAQTDSGYACLGIYNKGLLGVFDNKGSEKEYIDEYAKFNIQDVSNEYRFFQGRLAFTGGCLMVAPSYASIIRFYMCQDGKWVKKDSFDIGGSKFEERILNNMDFTLSKSDIRKCIDACKSNQYFYVLYDGTNLGHTQVTEFRYIMRFDTAGQLNCVYKVAPTISNICVSNDDTAIYALLIGKDGEYVVGKSCMEHN